MRVIEGFETVMFRSKFDSWPQSTNVAVSEDGRGKVAGKELIYADYLIFLCSSSGISTFIATSPLFLLCLEFFIDISFLMIT